MFKVFVALAPALLILPAQADELVTEAADLAEFQEHFCAAGRESERIFVVPAAIFTETQSVGCEDGTSTLRMTESADDPGHTVFNIDPPHGVESAFDCDGKADTGMSMVALNCIPASAEQSGHSKT